MKIHTTQNLNSLGRMQSTNNVPIPSSEIRLNYSERMRKQHLYDQQDTYEKNVSFKGKKEFIKAGKETAKKLINTAGKEKKWYDKFLTSGVFDSILDMMSHEVFVQAAISAIICCIFRPLAIMALPAKDKENNAYASAHSISSGIAGLASSLLIAVPFSKGVKHAQQYLLHNLKEKHILRMFPHVDLNSIKDVNGTRKPMNEWLDIFGNKFSKETKDVMMVAKPRPIETFSENTLKTEFGLDIDKAAMAGKSVSEWTTRSGEKLKFRPQDMFVEIKEEGMGKNYFSLGLADKKFLGETFDKLDINTIEKDGKRINPLNWKNKDGSDFMPDLLDNVYISSYRETHDAIPLYSGVKRTETTGKKETKYCSYQKNVANYDAAKVPDSLGTEITQRMLDEDACNTILYKLLIWLPDIITRPAVATGTIALIPAVLKNIFHLEKKKKPAESNNNMQNNIQINKKENEAAVRKAVA